MDYERERVRILRLHERLEQEATNYLKGLEFDELTAIESGDTLKCSGYVNPYVVSNESHFFSGSGTYTTLTVLKWLVHEINEPVFKVCEEYPLPYKGSALREYELKVYTNTSMKNRKVINRDKYGL